MQVPEGVPNRRVQNQLLGNVQDHCLSQVVNIHTREDKTLDLLLTNSPSPVNRVKGMPPIGKADHDIVYVEYDIKAKRIQQAPRKIFLYERADTDGLREHLITKTRPCNIQRFFHGCKNHNQSKSFDYFHTFAQNMNCGYTLEPSQ